MLLIDTEPQWCYLTGPYAKVHLLNHSISVLFHQGFDLNSLSKKLYKTNETSFVSFPLTWVFFFAGA